MCANIVVMRRSFALCVFFASVVTAQSQPLPNWFQDYRAAAYWAVAMVDGAVWKPITQTAEYLPPRWNVYASRRTDCTTLSTYYQQMINNFFAQNPQYKKFVLSATRTDRDSRGFRWLRTLKLPSANIRLTAQSTRDELWEGMVQTTCSVDIGIANP